MGPMRLMGQLELHHRIFMDQAALLAEDVVRPDTEEVDHNHLVRVAPPNTAADGNPMTVKKFQGTVNLGPRSWLWVR